VQLVGTLLVIASGVLLSLGESALALLRRTASE
jgi:hypothetical protein